MPLPPSILILGRDISLLETRRWVLEHVGFEVSATLDPKEAAKRIDAGSVDLFILCHTLSTEEHIYVLAHAHSQCPRVKTLILTTFRSGCESKEDFVLSEFASPRMLISTVFKLTDPPSASA